MLLTAEEISKIIENINKAASKILNNFFEDEPEIDLAEDAVIVSEKHKKEEVAKMIDSSTQEKLRKEESELLIEDIKKRFAKLKKISKDNFNMLEVALSCHKIANNYKKLARLNKWTEIESLFEEK